jgi:hypothetical protein
MIWRTEIFSAPAKILIPDGPAHSLVTVQSMIFQLQLLTVESIYLELKLNSFVLWQYPVFAIYLVQTLIKLQDNVTKVFVHLVFFSSPGE